METKLCAMCVRVNVPTDETVCEKCREFISGMSYEQKKVLLECYKAEVDTLLDYYKARKKTLDRMIDAKISRDGLGVAE